MLDNLTKLPIGGGVGFLLGVLAVWIIQPDTKGGIGLIIAVLVVAGIVAGRLLAFFLSKKNDQDADKQS